VKPIGLHDRSFVVRLTSLLSIEALILVSGNQKVWPAWERDYRTRGVALFMVQDGCHYHGKSEMHPLY
jgi:hypothetical protein